MPFRKYSNQFRKGVCQLTCDCGHSPSKTAEEYEIPLNTIKILVALIKVMIII